MPMGREPDGISSPITTAREPKGPTRPGDKGSAGDQALMDALVILGVCYAVLFLLMFSLRRHTA